MKKLSQKVPGFTLIEILVVIGIIAVLAAIVLIAINPARQFALARNSQRTSNVDSILNAIGQRLADNKGLFPIAAGCDALTASTTYTIAKTGAAVLPAAAIIDMSCLTPTYIPASLPVDPKGGSWTDAASYNTNYNVTVDSSGRYTVCAQNAAGETAISTAAPICITR